MLKHFFFFNRLQRVAIALLAVSIVLCLIVDVFMDSIFPVKAPLNDSHFRQEMKLFRESLLMRDSSFHHYKRQYHFNYQYTYRNIYPYHNNWKKNPVILFRFNPNQLDSTGFIALGLPPFMASNILKFRKKGGVYRIKSDFSKVYGLSSEKYAQLEAYIDLPVAKETVKQTQNEPVAIVDLNTADTTQLMQVKGIGRFLAINIVRFRNLSGGFVSVDQLKDLAGMHDDNFERIKSFCKVNQGGVRAIPVNTASVERLKIHPYIGFIKARAIYNLRRRKIKITDISTLREIPELSDDDIERLKPYLSFE